MKPTGFVCALILLLGSGVLAQSYIPPQQSTSGANSSLPGQPTPDQRWRSLGSGHSSLGLETTPHSLSLRTPQSTGLPRTTYGYRPDPIQTSTSGGDLYRSLPQDRFGLPSPSQRLYTNQSITPGRTRFIVPPGTETDSTAAQPWRRPLQPIEPTSPITAYPAGPIEPLSRGVPPAAGGASSSLALPLLPWERPSEAAAGPPTSPFGGLPSASLRLPYAGSDNTGGGQTASPETNLRAGSATPNEGLPSGSMIRPIGPAPENQPLPTADRAGPGQPSALARTVTGPLRSTESLANSSAQKYIEKAEAHLAAGEYAQAAGAYGLARVAAPRSPLPLLGRAVSLLMTGEFNNSANNLLLAVDLVPDAATFQADLKTLPDQELLSKRISELQKNVMGFDDFRLRFLLGYAEYCSGERTLGMLDMSRAARSFPPDRPAVGKVLEALRKEQLSRPPTTAPAAVR